MSKRSELQKAEEVLKTSRERLSIVVEEIGKLELAVEQLLFESKLRGSQRMNTTQKHTRLQELTEERDLLQKTIIAFEQRLPTLEQAARIETASEEKAPAYKKAKEEYIEKINSCPSDDVLVNAVGVIDDYYKEVRHAQDNFLTQGKVLNETLISENVESFGDISIPALRGDRAINHQKLIFLSDSLNRLSGEIEGLCHSFLQLTSRFSRSDTLIVDRPKPPVKEKCGCGGHFRQYRPNDATWKLYEDRRSPTQADTPNFIVIRCSDNAPDFPCERK